MPKRHVPLFPAPAKLHTSTSSNYIFRIRPSSETL